MGHFKPTTVIVDDEAHSAQLLQKLLEPYSLFGNISIYTNPTVAFSEVIEQQPKFLFLDIEMPGLSGLQLSDKMKHLTPKTKIIFVTAFEQYALEALRQNAFDYLLKPVDRTELIRIVEKLLSDQQNPISNPQPKTILVRSKEVVYQVDEDDIVFLEADCSYTTLTLSNQTNLLWSSNLGKILPLLSGNKFIRISRKHLVNRSYIHFYHPGQKFLQLKTSDKEYKLKVMLKIHDLKELLSN